MHMPNFNAQVKKNSIAFDIDFENIKQNVLTTKKEDKSPKKVEVIPNVEDQMRSKKNKLYINVQIVIGNLKEKLMQSMFLFVPEFLVIIKI